MADPTCAYCGANVRTSNWPDCCEPIEDMEARSYISGLRAEDWDSPEDATYDKEWKP